ncbi:hypothetical protein L208DRAFT_1233916, partial [Tricholoma matsutake]
PQIFDSTMENTKLFISSIVLYFHGRKPEFHTAESKIMFALSYIQGGKAQFSRNEAINQIAGENRAFATFKEFLERLEAQFGDPNLKATANAKSKTMYQGSLMVNEFILQFKAEASQMDMGEAALVEFLQGMIKSLTIYPLTTLYGGVVG